MKTWTQFNPLTGEIIGWCSDDTAHPGEGFIESPDGQPANSREHYVLDGKIKSYTPKELEAKANLPRGWKWVVAERKAVDLRTKEEREEEELQYILEERAKAYPPLTDFADALYWQENGDNSKMEAYLAACTEVKVRFPKPDKA